MKPAAFDYVRVDDAAEAVALLAEYGGEARILAGGQSLVAMMNMRLAEPRVLIDISRIAALDVIRETGDTVAVGAATRQATLGNWDGLAAALPLVARALPHIGHFQTRNRGTVCGSISHADPAAELPLVLATLDGTVRLRAARGERRVPARDFFTGTLATDRDEDEMIAAVDFPRADPADGTAFTEAALRHGDFAIVAVAAVVGRKGITLGIGGVADRPMVRNWSAADLSADAALDDALNDLAWALGARSDHHADAAYRRGLVRRLGRRVVLEARENAREKTPAETTP